MNWINFFFYVIVLNSLTGTVAYLLCKLLALVAKKYNAIRIIYPLYRLVLLFYIVPLGDIYIRCKSFVRFGAYALGDGFFGNPMIYEIMQCCLLIWFSGMLFVSLHYLKKWKSTDGSAGKTFLFGETNIVQFCKSCIQGKIGTR
ncbi:MAG: hypothetical protein KHY87_00685 [Lachnospiraceae bacterium]|nr:hypothetical protein [Lachnospiraceae bacterium]